MELNNKVPYLKMIQDIISRMSSNSFMLKGWAVTLVAGVFALSAKGSDSLFFLITYVPVILFWFLDSYYLQLERRYRMLYIRATGMKEEKIKFDLKAPKPNGSDKTTYIQSLTSHTELGFYLPLALLVAAVVIAQHA